MGDLIIQETKSERLDNGEYHTTVTMYTYTTGFGKTHVSIFPEGNHFVVGLTYATCGGCRYLFDSLEKAVHFCENDLLSILVKHEIEKGE